MVYMDFKTPMRIYSLINHILLYLHVALMDHLQQCIAITKLNCKVLLYINDLSVQKILI